MLKGRSLMRLHELEREGLGYREIARVTGHSRNTVRRYLRDGAGRHETKRAKRGSKLDPFKDLVTELVKGGLISTPAIMDRIVPEGYEGKETIVRDFVRSIKPKASREAVLARRYETKPGEQLQFDWGIFTYVDPRGDERRIPGLVATLGCTQAETPENYRDSLSKAIPLRSSAPPASKSRVGCLRHHLHTNTSSGSWVARGSTGSVLT